MTIKATNNILTQSELSQVYNIASNVIENLPPSAIQELLGGNEKDLKGLFEDILYATNMVVNNNSTRIGNFGSLSNFESSFDETLKIQSFNYFCATMLPNYTIGWRSIEWGNLIQLYPYSVYLAARSSGKSYCFCFALPIWRMWRYRKPEYFQRTSIDNKNSKETTIITNESSLGETHLSKIVSEIKANDLLHDVLLPKGRDLGKEKITAKNEALIELRSFGSKAIRGLHVGMVIVDDFLDKSALYSSKAREKFLEVFMGEITSIVEPYGSLIVSGTPFQKQDLYSTLKQDVRFKVFEYPAIDINGELLSPDRFTFEELMSRKKSLGSVVFSREYLITPVSDASSIFPWKYLQTAFIGMENIPFANNIESFPIKMKRVVVAIDFAKSANVGADYTVIVCIGKGLDGNYYIINLERGKGWSINEQVSRICRFANAYRPNVIKAEDNGFQSVMIDLVKGRGVNNISGFTTTVNKKDDLIGLPSLSASFERCEIKIPYKEGETRDIANLICGEFNSISYDSDSGKLQSADAHDDTALAIWIGITELKQKSGLKIEMI